MTFGKKRLWILLFCVWIVYPQEVEKTPTEEKRDFTIYVLLASKPHTDEQLWTLNNSAGFVVRDIRNEKRQDFIDDTELAITTRQGRLFLNGKKIATNYIRIDSREGDVGVLGNTYTGSLYILSDGTTWYLVNGVDLEDYVCSVLRSEGWPGWPLEINKVFAVTHRSYGVAKLLKARGKKKLGKDFFYDVLSTNAHQTYKGTHTYDNLRQAVEETRGMVLAHDKKPIEAMYDICCGGVITAHMKGIDFTIAPYLKRSYACTYCADCNAYSWEATYTKAEVAHIVKALDEKVLAVHHMRIANKDRAGIVHSLEVRSGKRKVSLTGRKAYTLFNDRAHFRDLKSGCYDIAILGEKVTFTGRGYGHHLGLCQWGARQMVKLGKSWLDIVSFYYPGTTIMRLEGR